MNSSPPPIGVVLFNLGGPDSLQAVKPFLYNLFLDPDIFTFPLSFLFRKPLAYFISSLRAPKSQVYYEAMGGKSPITELTLQQASALETKLNESSHEGRRFKVVVAMRYWRPFTQDALHSLQKEGVRQVILLPLYPQYSYTTTRSSEREWERLVQKSKISFDRVDLVKSYQDHPFYIRAMVLRIREALSRFSNVEEKDIHLLFSAHGIPIREIEKGDPYDQQIRQSMELILKELQVSCPAHLSYQSKVGPLKWLSPNTVDTIQQLAEKGVKNIVAVPISFVSDHSETLYELKMLYGDLALRLGMKQYELMPALNDSPVFIEALRDLVLIKTLSGAHS